MNPRLDGIKAGCIRTEREAFDLDITEYKDAYQAEEYLSDGFQESYIYPLRSIVFHPRYEVTAISFPSSLFKFFVLIRNSAACGISRFIFTIHEIHDIFPTY